MNTLRIQTVVQQNGLLHVEGTPFKAGDQVNLWVTPAKPQAVEVVDRLRGSVRKYDQPFESAAAPSDWEACR